MHPTEKIPAIGALMAMRRGIAMRLILYTSSSFFIILKLFIGCKYTSAFACTAAWHLMSVQFC